MSCDHDDILFDDTLLGESSKNKESSEGEESSEDILVKVKNKDKLIQFTSPIETVYSIGQLCTYVPRTMRAIMEQEGGFSAYIGKVHGTYVRAFRKGFPDEPRLNPYEEFIAMLEENNEMEKLFGDLHVVLTGESETAEKKRKGKKK